MAAPVANPEELVPFTPRRRAQIPARLVVMTTCLVIGLVIAAFGGFVLAKRAPVSWPTSRGLDVLAVGFLVAATPASFFVWRDRRRRIDIDDRLPDFLTDVASLHKAGLTLQDSILAAAEGKYGALDAHVQTAADQVRWNLPVLTVLENMQRDVGTPLAVRTFTVVIEAGRTGGDVPEVLEIAAGNARSTVQMRQQRARAMSLYTIITYVASLVFLGVALAMQTIFVPRMIGSFGPNGGGGIGLASSLPSPDEFRFMFYTAGLVQAAGNGIVGGIMGEGSATAGLRHACIMVALCAAAFAVV